MLAVRSVIACAYFLLVYTTTKSVIRPTTESHRDSCTLSYLIPRPQGLVFLASVLPAMHICDVYGIGPSGKCLLDASCSAQGYCSRFVLSWTRRFVCCHPEIFIFTSCRYILSIHTQTWSLLLNTPVDKLTFSATRVWFGYLCTTYLIVDATPFHSFIQSVIHSFVLPEHHCQVDLHAD